MSGLTELIEVIAKAGHEADFHENKYLNSEQNSAERDRNAHCWKTIMAPAIAKAVLALREQEQDLPGRIMEAVGRFSFEKLTVDQALDCVRQTIAQYQDADVRSLKRIGELMQRENDRNSFDVERQIQSKPPSQPSANVSGETREHDWILEYTPIVCRNCAIAAKDSTTTRCPELEQPVAQAAGDVVERMRSAAIKVWPEYFADPPADDEKMYLDGVMSAAAVLLDEALGEPSENEMIATANSETNWKFTPNGDYDRVRRIFANRRARLLTKPPQETREEKVTICECGLARCYHFHPSDNPLAYRRQDGKPPVCSGYRPREENYWKAKP